MYQSKFNILAVLCLFVLLFSFRFSAAQSFSTSNLKGISLINPTSLQFGPDGRLYISQQNGALYACTVTRDGNNNYSVTKKETINLVKSIQNYNDNGSVHNGATERQITGLLVTGTAQFPVLYVGSSDYRIGAGTSKGDVDLDTNSGIISRLTWNGSTWEKIDLIRGLPRSEENHANNGMQLDKANNILYVASGGNTNGGGPSNNFAFITEYALAAAILAVDLDVIDSKPAYTDQRTGAKFIYDLPTLDDPTRPNINKTHPDFPYGSNHPLYNSTVDVGDPFGGNDGLNQAKIVKSGPVQVFSPGFRNIYDLVLTEDGRLYTWDNGANGGWGGHPHQEGGGSVTNNWVASNLPDSKSGSMTSGWVGEDGVQDAPVNNKDGLHFVGYTSDYDPFTTGANPADAYYGGHPTPIRANPAGAGLYTHDHALGTFNNNGFVGGYWRTAITGNPATSLPTDWPPVPLSQANPIEGDFQNAGTDDPSFWSFEGLKSYSTNGLAMYTASNFNGAMQGHLLAAAHNNKIYEIHLNKNGTINNPRVDINNNTDVEVFGENFGTSPLPLDVIAQGDGEIFQGTVWVANYLNNTITVFEPQDYFDCLLPGEPSYDPLADYDQDGYTNQDELDTNTDPCNGASQPKDADQDFIPDSLDPDDDNDGISDVTDNFQLDPQNGLTTKLPIKYPLLNGDPGTGIAGLGFTGLMNNGSDYINLIKDKTNSNVIILYGGAPGQLGIGGFPGDPIPPGDALGTANDQKNAFHFGVNVTSATPPFTVSSEIVGPIFATTPQNHQSAGIFIGTGTQSDYLKIVANANGGKGGIQVVFEKNNVPTSFQYNVSAVSNASYFKLLLSVNPQQGTVQPKYSLAGGPEVAVGSPIAVSGALLNAIQNQPALAVGVIATSRGSTSPFEVSWDNIEITYDPLTATGQWQQVVPQSGLPTKRHENAYVQAGGKFYLLGGRGSQNKKVDIYDPVKKTWTQSTSTHPIELHHFQAVTYQGLIYVLGAFTGGYPGEVPVEQIYIYNPAADTWHVDGNIPRPRGSAGAVVYNDKIYLVGGLKDGHKGNYVQWFDEYDPKTGTWKTLPNVPHFRDHFQAAVVNGKLVIAGGRLSDADQNLASQNYDPKLLPPLPSNTNVFNVTVPMVDLYDFGSQTWSNHSLPPIPTPRGGTASAVLGSEVLVIGGESGTTTDAHSETEAFDVNRQTWRSLAPLLPEGSFKGRHATQAIVNNGGVYIAAGSGKQGGSASTELNSQQAFFLNGATTPTGTSLTKSQLTASPSSLNYGPIAPNQTVSKTITLANTSGNQAIDLLNVSITGNSAFSLVAPPPSKLLLPGETMNIGVAVKSSNQGSITGSLSVNHTASTAPLSVSLLAEVTNEGGGTAPTVENPIADITVPKSAAAQTINLSSVFADDGGASNLTYAASSANPSVVSTSLSGSTLTLSFGSAGTAQVTVTATDADGQATSSIFTATITDGNTPVPVIALNAGGGQVQHGGINWQADQHYTGGSTYTGNNSIAGTTNDAIYQSERWGAVSYSIPVANGTYSLQLHFAEIYLKDGATGQRVFDVVVEGQKVLTDFDILSKTAGKANTAWVETVSNVVVSDGKLSIALQKLVENPKLSGIALYGSSGTPPTNQSPVVNAGQDKTLTLPANSVQLTATASDADGSIASYSWTKVSGPGASLSGTSSQTLTASSLVAGSYTFQVSVKDNQGASASDQVLVVVNSAGVSDVLYRVNAGGALITSGNTKPDWGTDSQTSPSPYRSGGSLATTSATVTSAQSVPSGTPAAMFQTERYGPMSWAIPVTQGEQVEVRLYFAETYHTQSGARLFDIVLEGKTVESSLDIYAQTGGKNVGMMKSYAITSDGNVNINFVAVVENPAIKGIEIVRASSTPGANQPPVVDAGQDKTLTLPTNSVQLTATASDADGSIASYSWTKVSGPGASLSGTSSQTLTASSLVAGSYTFQVTVTDNSNAKASDQVQVVVNEPSGGGGNATLWLEAECASVGNNWTAATNNGASNGSYLVYPSGSSMNSAPTSSADHVVFTVTLSQASSYHLFARVKAPSLGSNSFWVQVDNGAWLKWWEGIQVSNSFAWNEVLNSPFSLSAGTHTIKIGYRESGTQLDKLSLSQSATLPSGTGQPASNCGTTPTNQPPVVDAGSDQTLTLPTNTIKLTATASDADGSITSYQWSKVSGPGASLSGTSTSQLTAANLVAGSYTFQVSVKDNQGASASDQVQVVVNEPSGGGDKLILALNAGGGQVQHGGINWQADQHYTGGSTYTGNNSIAGTTNDAIYQSERWGAVSYSIPVANGTYSLQLHFAEIYLKDGATGQRVFDVVVEGQKVLTDFDILSKTAGKANTAWVETVSNVVVSDGKLSIALQKLVENPKLSGIALYGSSGTPPTNQSPVVNAGQDKTLTLPANSVQLTATASDADGSIASYSWTKVSGPGASLSGTSSQTLTASSLVAGSYTFQVSVKDNQGASASDQVLVTVGDGGGGEPGNQPPTADAGPDKTLTLPSNSIILRGKGTDPDGSFRAFLWEKVSGPSATLNQANTANLKLSNLVAGVYVFRFSATDNDGATGSDEMTLTVKGAAGSLAARMSSAKSKTDVVASPSSITDHESKFVVYPIPFEDQITIELKDALATDVAVELYTTLGTQIPIRSGDIRYEDDRIILDLPNRVYGGDMIILVVKDLRGQWYTTQKLLRAN